MSQMIETLKFYSGQHKPQHLTDEQYKSCLAYYTEEQLQETANMLEKVLAE